MRDLESGSKRWEGRRDLRRDAGGPLYHQACPLGFGFSEDDLDDVVQDSFDADEALEDEAEGEFDDRAPVPTILADGRSEALPSRRPHAPHALMEVQQFLVTQMSQMNRRVSDVYELHQRRNQEDRKETYILVFAFSVVLVFCFAAFFMHQIEVRDLHSGLQDELQRQEDRTRFELREKIEMLGSKQLPELLALLDGRLEALEDSEQSSREALSSVVEQEGKRHRRQAGEMLLLLEDRLDRLQRELHDMRQLQLQGVAAEKPVSEHGPRSGASGAVPPVSGLVRTPPNR